MATILLPSSKTKDATTKDPSLRAKIGPFISKLSTMTASSGLHLEPIRGARDRRVRTARVTDFYRAVLFELAADGEVVYVIHGIWPHDEAIKIAESVTVHVNPRNGITEVVNVGDLIGLDPRAVEEARRTAQAELAAAQREADELARETARIQAANAEARRRNEEAARGADASSAPTQAPGTGTVDTGSQRGEGGAVAGVDVGTASVPGAVVVPSRDQAPVWPDGLTVEMLHDELGIDVRLGAAALAAQRESQLLDLASTTRVAWQGEALLNLATGATIEEIREDFGLRHSRDIAAEPTDADLIEGLRTRAARSTFTWLESDEDLRRAIEGLSFAEWQLFLHPQQRAIVERRANGPMRVSGGAGTGKTVIAVHRAVELAKRDKADEQEPRILLTTYTRNLADDLRRQVAQLEPRLPFTEKLSESGVMVSGLDRVARMILQQAGAKISPIAQEVIGQPRARVLTYPRENVWQEVLTLMGDELPERLRSADFLESEYELIVLPQRVTTLKQYLRVRRPGRGVALDRSKRAAVWKAMERYRDRSADLGVTSFDEQLALAAAWLDHEAALGTPRPFRHVLVDEAQDLTPAHLQLLRALVEPGPDDLFLAEDSHQRIYGKKITLSHYGIQVRGRSRRLTRNYRTTRQNLDVAFGILDPGTYEDMEGQAEEHHYVSPRSGPEPLLLHASDRADELSKAAELLAVWLVSALRRGPARVPLSRGILAESTILSPSCSTSMELSPVGKCRLTTSSRSARSASILPGEMLARS